MPNEVDFRTLLFTNVLFKTRFSELNGKYPYITVCVSLLFRISLIQHVSWGNPGWVHLCPFWSCSYSAHWGWEQCITDSLHVVMNNMLWMLTLWTDFVRCWGWLNINFRPLFVGVTGLELVTRWFVCRVLHDGHTLMSCLIRVAVLYEGDFHIPVRGLLQLLLWSSPSSWQPQLAHKNDPLHGKVLQISTLQ